MKRLDRGGVEFAYEDAGQGSPAMVFLHGIACDHTHFLPQVAHFSTHRRVVAVDLRGHGASDAPDGTYETTLLAADTAWLIDELSLERPMVVGHSLGGVVALALASHFPEVPGAIAALDSPLLPPPGREETMQGLFERLRTGDYPSEITRYFAAFFLDTDDAGRRRHILERVAQTPPHAVISAWEQGALHFDMASAARACRVPFLYIDAGTPNARLDLLDELCSTLAIGRTVGAGHFHQLEVPDQVNAMLERFMATNRL